MQGPRRRYGWRCNPIGYQPNYTHIPNEKAWNLREAVFLKSVCATPRGTSSLDHLRENFTTTAFGVPSGLIAEFDAFAENGRAVAQPAH